MTKDEEQELAALIEEAEPFTRASDADKPESSEPETETPGTSEEGSAGNQSDATETESGRQEDGELLAVTMRARIADLNERAEELATILSAASLSVRSGRRVDVDALGTSLSVWSVSLDELQADVSSITGADVPPELPSLDRAVTQWRRDSARRLNGNANGRQRPCRPAPAAGTRRRSARADRQTGRSPG